MTFLLQANNPEMKIELFLWKDLLEEKTCPHDYAECTYEELPQYVQSHNTESIVPMGFNCCPVMVRSPATQAFPSAAFFESATNL